jgi:HAD superfamily hydrolase (TIGR01450 family)
VHDIKKSRWFEIDNLEDLTKADKLFSGFDSHNKKAFILDIDGTILIGDKPIEPAVNWVVKNSHKYDFYFLTNNTSRIPGNYVKKLAKSGIKTTEEKIATPLFPLIDYLHRQKIKSAYLVANQTVTQYIKKRCPEVSFSYDFERNQAIVLTYDTEIAFEKLKNICLLLNNRPIEYLATHTDVFCPTEKGGVPDIGSYMALIKTVTDKEPSIVFGKPDINLIKLYVEKYGASKLAIAGDRLYTDKVLADDSKIDFICVLSGETDRYDVAVANFEKYPAAVVRDLGEIEEL